MHADAPLPHGRENGPLLWLPALLALLLAVPALVRRDAWPVDEPRYGEIAMEMARNGDFLLPRLNGEVYTHKPPLLFWLGNAIAPFTGWERGLPLRLVSALAGAASVLLTTLLAARLAGPRAGRLAGLVLVLVPLELAISEAAMFDTLLAACVALAWTGLARDAFARPGETVLGLKPRAGGAILFGLGLGLGLLAKGPMAAALTVPGALAFRLASPAGSPRRLRALAPSSFAAIAAAVALVVAGAWFVPAAIRGGSEYLAETLGRQTVGRAVDGWAHAQPFWFYLAVLPGVAFPFSFLVPSAVQGRALEHPAGLLSAAWLVTGLAAISLVSGKQVHYLVPLLPPLSILVGRLVDERDAPVWATRAIAAVFILACAAAVASPLVLRLGILGEADRRILESSPEHRAAIAAIAPAGAATLAALLLAAVARRVRPRLPRALLPFAASAVLWLSVSHFVIPKADAFASGRPFGEAVRAHVESAREVAAYRVNRNGAISFYSGVRPIPALHEAAEITEILERPGSELHYVVAKTRDGEALARHLGVRLEPVAEGWNDWVRTSLFRISRPEGPRR